MVNPEHGKSFLGRKNCQNNLKNCQKSNLRKKSKPSIRCAVCSHKLVNEEKSEFLNDLVSPYAKSVHKLQLFGSDNVTVQEFVNPHNHHFHSVQVRFLSKNCNLAKESFFAVMGIMAVQVVEFTSE